MPLKSPSFFSNDFEKHQCCWLAYYRVSRRAESSWRPAGRSQAQDVTGSEACSHFGGNSPCCGVGAAPSLHSQTSAGGESSTVRLKEQNGQDCSKGARNPELHPFKLHLPIFFFIPTYRLIFIFKPIYFLPLNAFIQEENSKYIMEVLVFPFILKQVAIFK